MKKIIAYMLLIILVLIMMTFSCVSGGGGNINGADSGAASSCCDTPNVQATQATSATETYGAEQFYIQLTAIAEQDQ